MNQENPKQRTTVFLDDEKRAPYELMRSLFIASNHTPQSFVEEKRLPQSAIEIIEKDNWVKIREDLNRRNPDSLKTLVALMTDSSIVIEIDLYTMKMAQVQDQVNNLKEYHQKWGDYFARHPDGSIVYDVLQQPILMHIPTSPHELSARKAHYGVILDYLKILDSIDNVQARLAGKVTEILIETPTVEYSHLLEIKKDEQ